ncbi:hypothetical protein KAR91_59975 [Candidatus Pacearchaeota archaeon]|nr:hypothetical protein [Candidatus Pacearchaeota archaeon]
MTCFDDIPEDKEQCFPCEICGGNIKLIDGFWQCDTCDFEPEKGKK